MKFISSILALLFSLLLTNIAIAYPVKLKVMDAIYNAHFYKHSEPRSHTVMLVHNALSTNKDAFIDSLATALHDSGKNVLAVNLSLRISDRQENINMCNQVNRHHFDDAIAEIALWLKWLQSKQHVTKVSLLGYGLGANQVALYLSRHENNKVHKAVLVSALSQRVLVQENSSRQNVDQILNKIVSLDKDYILEDVSFLGCQETQVTASSFASYYQASPLFSTSFLASRINVPMLFISGQDDPHQDAIKQKISIFHADNNNIQVEFLPDTPAHFPQLSIVELLLILQKFVV